MTTYSTLFTEWFEDHYSSIAWATPKQVKIVVFNSLPVFDDDAKSKFYSLEALADAYADGWVPSTSTVEARLSNTGSSVPLYLQKITISSKEYLQLVRASSTYVAVEDGEGWYLENPDVEGVVQEVFAGAIWYLEGTHDGVINPVLFATKYGVGDYTVAHDGTVYGQFETGVSPGNQYVVAYDPVNKFSIGNVLLRLDIPEWEGAHSHHMWIQPQRVNYTANPSFENAETSWWRAGSIGGVGGASVNRVVGGIDTERIYCGHVQSDPENGPRVNLPGISGNYLSTPDSAALSITGDIDIQVKVAMADWTPAAISILAAKESSASTRSYRLAVNTSGVLALTTSGNGSAIVTTLSTVATGVANGATKWVRATLDSDNGAGSNLVKFYLSDDGTTWTQLGTTVTTAATRAVFDSTSPLEIGSRFLGTQERLNGTIYRAIVKNGINGTTVADFDATKFATNDSTTCVAVTGETWTLNKSGASPATVVSGWYSPIVLESNLFPNTSGWFSVSFYASGTGSLRFGLVAHNVSYTLTTFICSEESELTGGSSTSSFRKFTGLFSALPDTADYHFRVEFIGEEFWIDNVLVDPNPGQYDYFDGNSTDSFSEDFQWMNDSSDAHFSMWYNNYRNSKARLVGAFDTTDGVYKPGLVDLWSPTGASVSVHWDAVSPITPINWIGDYNHPLFDISNTAVSLIDYEVAYTSGTNNS